MAVAFGWRRRHPLVERVAMLRHRIPGRTQRIVGYAFALMLMLSGTYVVWAAQPEEPPAIAPSAGLVHGTPQATPDLGSFPFAVTGRPVKLEKNRIAGPELHMVFAPRAPLYFQADSVSTARDGGWILEGHVRITLAVTRMVRAGPEVITNDVRPVIATAERAVLAPQPGGGFEAHLEKGSVQF